MRLATSRSPVTRLITSYLSLISYCDIPKFPGAIVLSLLGIAALEVVILSKRLLIPPKTGNCFFGIAGTWSEDCGDSGFKVYILGLQVYLKAAWIIIMSGLPFTFTKASETLTPTRMNTIISHSHSFNTKNKLKLITPAIAT